MKTIYALKKNTLKLNQLALKSTENVVIKTINTVEDLQDYTVKKLKTTFIFTDKQLDDVFNNLEKGKGMIWKNINKTLDYFSKN
jgi:hypothetical protein